MPWTRCTRPRRTRSPAAGRRSRDRPRPRGCRDSWREDSARGAATRPGDGRPTPRAAASASTTRPRSASPRLDVEGRQNARSKMSSAHAPPRRSASRHSRVWWSGRQIGRASMPARSSDASTSSRAGPAPAEPRAVGVQPERRVGPGRARGRHEAREAADRRVVERGVRAPAGEERVDLLQLGEAERGADVRQAVVEADLVVVVGEPGQPRLGREVAGAPGERLVVGHEHPAAAGGDELVAVEAEAADPPDRADLAAGVAARAVGRAERLGRVLDHRDAVALGGVDHRLEVGRMAQQVHDLDRRRLPRPGPRPPVQLRGDERRIEVVGLALRVDEDGRRARVPRPGWPRRRRSGSGR